MATMNVSGTVCLVDGNALGDTGRCFKNTGFNQKKNIWTKNYPPHKNETTTISTTKKKATLIHLNHFSPSTPGSPAACARDGPRGQCHNATAFYRVCSQESGWRRPASPCQLVASDQNIGHQCHKHHPTAIALATRVPVETGQRLRSSASRCCWRNPPRPRVLQRHWRARSLHHRQILIRHRLHRHPTMMLQRSWKLLKPNWVRWMRKRKLREDFESIFLALCHASGELEKLKEQLETKDEIIARLNNENGILRRQPEGHDDQQHWQCWRRQWHNNDVPMTDGCLCLTSLSEAVRK